MCELIHGLFADTLHTFLLIRTLRGNWRQIPKKVANFIANTVMGHIWTTLLQVAVEVKDGDRKEHSEAISEKPEIYQWIKERIDCMLAPEQ